MKIVQDGAPASFKTPNKVRNRPKRVTGLDDLDLGVVKTNCQQLLFIR